ncbi:DUF6913 domain-containing protein [Dysgonomonas sp. ZJ279]|uniref:DUF6913 domain-containing protein n=1 Tax=Dysgonomonas sp. ZJ279 TaxID=2709796 RepID=UPI0013ECDD76|nr:hypothetical protein [Dysgonomonas sp. ZJ279]
MLDFYIKKKVNSVLKNHTRKHVFRSPENMVTILILFNSKDWKEVSEIAQDMRDNGKEVLLWTIQPKNAPALDMPNVRIITSKELSKTQVLSSSAINEFESLEYDTLLDLTTKDENALLYLLGINTSEFCVGIKELDYKVFDFIILKEDDKNLVETYTQIKFYLNNIR